MLCLCRVGYLGKQVIKLLIFLLVQVSLYLGHRYPGLFSQEDDLCTTYKENLKFWGLGPQDGFPICLRLWHDWRQFSDALHRIMSRFQCIINLEFSQKYSSVFYHGVWRASRAVRILQCWTKRTISVCLLLSVKSALLGSVTAAILHTNTQK